MKVSLLCQLLGLVDRQIVAKAVSTHGSDKHAKGHDTWTHLVSMLFCHIANATSCREIANGLRSATGNLSHLGMRRAPSKSTVSYANKHRRWEVFRDIYLGLLKRLEPDTRQRRRYARTIKRKVFIMDSTTISLCLKSFDWAHFRQRKGGIKLHTVLDYDTCLPVFVHQTEAKVHDSKAAALFKWPRGSVGVFDRAYVDFGFLDDLDSTGVRFVTRLKTNVDYEAIDEYYDGVQDFVTESDQDIRLTGATASRKYPKTLRLVVVHDPSEDRWLHLLTNEMSWTAQHVGQLYQARWAIETFFKQLKQLLRIKTFIGTSENAVRIQMWTAMIMMLLLKYCKRKARHAWFLSNLSNLASFLRLNLFVKIDLWKWLNKPYHEAKPSMAQGMLFDTG